MAHQKLSPRQKMINMMYLVLTAMLALNVSSEVLNAFVRMEEGFQQTIAIVSSNNRKSYEEFVAGAQKDPAKVGKWLEKATLVKDQTKQLTNFIDSIKIGLIKTSEGDDSPALQNGVIVPREISKLDDTDTGTRLLIGDNKKGQAYELTEKINSYRDFLIGLIKESSGDSALSSTINGLLRTEKTEEGGVNMRSVGTPLDWEQSLFFNTTLISDIALLSKFRLDILSCESAMLNHFYVKIGADDFKFSKVKVIVKSNTDYVLVNSPYEAEIFLAAYNPDTKTEVTIGGGQPKPSGEDGMVRYTATSSSAGPVRLPGTITYLDPKGEKVTDRFEINYNVIKPMATVSPAKMNVLYIGVPNPLDVSVGAGISPDKIRASVRGGSELSRSGDYFIYTPSAGMRNCEIDVTAEVGGKWESMGSAKFRVRDIPSPMPAVEGIAGKSATKSEISASQGILAKMPADFEFDVKVSVKSFTLSVVGGDGYLSSEPSGSGYFTERQRRLFGGLKSGSQVVITDIKANGPAGNVLDLADLVIRIK